MDRHTFTASITEARPAITSPDALVWLTVREHDRGVDLGSIDEIALRAWQLRIVAGLSPDEPLPPGRRFLIAIQPDPTQG